jgi:hypothetical protein
MTPVCPSCELRQQLQVAMVNESSVADRAEQSNPVSAQTWLELDYKPSK